MLQWQMEEEAEEPVDAAQEDLVQTLTHIVQAELAVQV